MPILVFLIKHRRLAISGAVVLMIALSGVIGWFNGYGACRAKFKAAGQGVTIEDNNEVAKVRAVARDVKSTAIRLHNGTF